MNNYLDLITQLYEEIKSRSRKYKTLHQFDTSMYIQIATNLSPSFISHVNK